MRPVPLEGQLALPFDSVPAPTASGALPERRIALGATLIAYRLRRAKRRTIGFQIDDAGLTISAPRRVTLREIEAAIVEKQRWILAKTVEWRAWRDRQGVPPVVLADGGQLPLLGGSVTIRLRPEGGTTRLHAESAELALALPSHAAESQIRDALAAWLQAEARRIFEARLQRFDVHRDARFKGWALSSARSQWGSCTHDGRIRLNWRLIHFSLPVIDYVIAHELAHMQELNHSARFWRTVGQLLPGFEAARDAIRRVDIAALPI
jgi:predicted metal-dependent hydrolase